VRAHSQTGIIQRATQKELIRPPIHICAVVLFLLCCVFVCVTYFCSYSCPDGVHVRVSAVPGCARIHTLHSHRVYMVDNTILRFVRGTSVCVDLFSIFLLHSCPDGVHARVPAMAGCARTRGCRSPHSLAPAVGGRSRTRNASHMFQGGERE